MTHHFDPAIFAGIPIHQTRRQVSEEIERMIAFLDSLDGDCDLEPNGDEMDASYCEGRFRYVSNPHEDDEPSLGWRNTGPQEGVSFFASSSDLEFDPAEMGIADEGGLAEQMMRCVA